MKHDLPTKKALLAGRRYEDLSEAEKRTYGLIHKQEGRAAAERIAANLRKQTAGI